jgi:hypothetical protein
VGVDILISDKADIKPKLIIRETEGHFVGASLAIFLGFTASGIHLGFLILSLQAAFC